MLWLQLVQSGEITLRNPILNEVFSYTCFVISMTGKRATDLVVSMGNYSGRQCRVYCNVRIKFTIHESQLCRDSNARQVCNKQLNLNPGKLFHKKELP